jgi:prephenate dehydratase
VVESPAEAMVKALADGTGAALASQESGERAGLRVIANRTTDHADNAIRFVVVGRDDGLTPGSNRTTVAVKPRAGASLTSLFGTLSAHRVEMVRVASLPGSPLLVLELDGNRSQSNVASLLTSLVVEGGEVHVLGSYSAHRRVALSLLPSANPVGLR